MNDSDRVFGGTGLEGEGDFDGGVCNLGMPRVLGGVWDLGLHNILTGKDFVGEFGFGAICGFI